MLNKIRNMANDCELRAILPKENRDIFLGDAFITGLASNNIKETNACLPYHYKALMKLLWALVKAHEDCFCLAESISILNLVLYHCNFFLFTHKALLECAALYSWHIKHTLCSSSILPLSVHATSRHFKRFTKTAELSCLNMLLLRTKI